MSVNYTEDLRHTLQCRTYPLGSFDKLPEELTYPLVTPVLFEETGKFI